MYLRKFFLLGFLVLLGFLYGAFARGKKDENPREYKYNAVGKYPLFDPETAPKEIRDQVMRGFHILAETQKHLPEYAGDSISCTNCHFAAGNSFGGHKNGFSLVGVSHIYPKTLASGEPYTLAERINSCFIRSLNGKKVPLDSPDMKAMVAYLDWISSGIPKLDSYPWLGSKKLVSRHTPNAENGAKLYEMKCAPCHGKNGEGQKRPDDLSYPPLWGEDSFNDDAGMHKLEMFAYFIYENMPYNDPELTVEEALDIAAYVTSRPRPKFVPAK